MADGRQSCHLKGYPTDDTKKRQNRELRIEAQASKPPIGSVSEQLQIELERLKRLTGTGVELRVLHCPTVESRVSGEVREETVLIYESDLTQALRVLKHEFIDYLVSKAIRPYEKAARYYRTMINALICELGEDAYNEKEKVVEALTRTIS